MTKTQLFENVLKEARFTPGPFGKWNQSCKLYKNGKLSSSPGHYIDLEQACSTISQECQYFDYAYDDFGIQLICPIRKLDVAETMKEWEARNKKNHDARARYIPAHMEK